MNRYVVTRNLGSYHNNGPIYMEYVCSFWASESDTQAIYPVAGKAGRYVIEKLKDISFLRENPRKVYNFQEKAGFFSIHRLRQEFDRLDTVLSSQ